MEEFRPVEISRGYLNNLMKDSKCLSAISKFSPEKFDISKQFINTLKQKQHSLVKELGHHFRPNYSDDYFILKGRETTLNHLLSSNYSHTKEGFMAKCFSSYYRYLGGVDNSYKNEIYNFLYNFNLDRSSSDAYRLHFSLILRDESIDRSTFDISYDAFKQSVKAIHNYGVGAPSIRNISDSIKIRDTLNKTIRLNDLEEIDLDTLTTYINLNRKSLIDLLKIHLNFIARDNISGAFMYNEEYVKPYTLKRKNINPYLDNVWEQGIGFWEFIQKLKGSTDEYYKVYTEGASTMNTLLRDILKNMGLEVFPSNVNEYIEAYKNALENETLDEFYDEYDGMFWNMLDVCTGDTIKPESLNSPILQNEKFADSFSELALDIVEDIEDYLITTDKIVFYSKEIDAFIENHIDTDSQLNSLLSEFEDILLENSDDCYSISTPLIIGKQSALFPSELDTDYAIVSILTHNPSSPSLEGAFNLSEKRVHMCEYNTLKSALSINDNIESLLSKYKTMTQDN